MYAQPKTEPIRKPGSRTKYAVLRHRRIARALHSRFALFQGRIFLVSGGTSFKDLRQQLQAMECWTRCDRETFLRKFGSDGELNVRQLQQISTSMEHWSRELEKCTRKSPLYRERDEQLAEIEQLKQRLDFAAKTLRAPSDCGTCFLLDPVQQAEFDRVIEVNWREHPGQSICARTRELARLVFWFGGHVALQRFVRAMLETTDPSYPYLERVEALSNWLRILQQRLSHEESWIIAYELKQSSQFKEFVEAATMKEVWPAVKKCNLPERLERYQKNLTQVRDWANRNKLVEFPAVVAAWSVATKGGKELPRRVVQLLRDSHTAERFVTRVEHLIDISSSPGYDQVVELLNSNDVCLSHNVIEKVGQWLHDGHASEDVLYCAKNLRIIAIGAEVSPSVARRGAARFERQFGDSAFKWFSQVHGHIFSNEQVEMIDTVFRWMEKFSDFQLESKMKCTIVPALDNLKQLLKLKGNNASEFANQVKDWYGKAKAVAEYFPKEVTYPKQLRHWLRRLGYYQRLSDAECSVPKSIRGNLAAVGKRQKELSYLRSRVEMGNAPEKLRQRFDYLSRVQIDERKNERKNIRDLQEACLLAGLRALRHKLIKEAKAIWTKTAKQSLRHDWSENRIVEIGQWVSRMLPQQQSFLRKLLESHVENGANYKSQLAFNQSWIREMKRKGFAVDQWLAPARKLTRIGEREVMVSVSQDPYEIFMMGNYFGSCLSQGGCNEMSVLSNAADANKQVVYVHDMNGTVLARQLITINRKRELLRYCLYVATKEISGEDCKLKYRTVVDGFCKDLARRVGLKLGQDGSPFSLSNQFWYDDGAEEWYEEKDGSETTSVEEVSETKKVENAIGDTYVCVQANYSATSVLDVQTCFSASWIVDDWRHDKRLPIARLFSTMLS